VLDSAVEARHIYWNAAEPIAKENTRKRSEQNKPVYENVDYMTPQEADKIMAWVRDYYPGPNRMRWYAYFSTLMYTGARSAEGRALHWSKDRQSDILIHHSMDRHHNRGETKTGARGNRSVPMIDDYVKILAEWEEDCPSVQGSEWEVEQILRAQPDLSKVSDYELERVCRISRHIFRRMRQKLGLPMRTRKENGKPGATAVMPILSRKMGLMFANRNGGDIAYVFALKAFHRAQRACGIVKRDVHGNPIMTNIDQREAPALPIIEQLRAEGFTTYAALARELNARGVKTVSGGPWYFEKVRKLLAPPVPAAKYGLHALRHFYVSLLAHSGEFTLDEVGRFVGHTHTEMTQRYLHLFRDAEKEEQNRRKVARAFRATMPRDTKVAKFDTTAPVRLKAIAITGH
jgi:integrase